MDNKKRIEYIDVYKGIGIMLMILGHTYSFGWMFNKIVYSFHVPLFYFISGFLYKDRDYNVLDVIVKKCKSLMIPYLFFGIIHICHACLTIGFDSKFFANLFLFCTGGLPVPGTGWFLFVMFITEIFYYCVRKLDRFGPIIVNAIVILLAALGVLTSTFHDKCFWGLNSALFSVLIVHMGYLCHKYIDTKPLKFVMNCNLPLLVMMSVPFVVLALVNDEVNMRAAYFGVIPLTIVNILAFSILILAISKWFFKKFRRVGEVVSFVGENSIVFLGLNQLIITDFQKVLLRTNAFFGVLIFLAVIIICWCVTWAIKKCKLGVLIAK